MKTELDFFSKIGAAILLIWWLVSVFTCVLWNKWLMPDLYAIHIGVLDAMALWAVAVISFFWIKGSK